MARQLIVVGAGMGGLTSALYLAQRGYQVQVFEARDHAGGLAASRVIEGLRFDAGPYILLDRPGLEWAFDRLNLKLDDHIELRRIDSVYEVMSPTSPVIRFYNDRGQTAHGMESNWAGSAQRYLNFITRTETIYQRLQPLQWLPQPGLGDLLQLGAWRDAAFLLRSLGAFLSVMHLPPPVIHAIGIWTHVAGQTLNRAPSPLAFVPVLVHRFGAYYPVGGIGAIPERLAEQARAVGVSFHYQTKVRSIRCKDRTVQGVELDDGTMVPADAVIANASGVGSYLELTNAIPSSVRRKLQRLPLQSPGICVYLAVRHPTPPPYLRFFLPGGDAWCRLLVTPAILAPELAHDRWYPARLIAPMDHTITEAGGVEVQTAFLNRVLSETWWQDQVGEYRVIDTRIPAEWGTAYHLYHNSMNPVMTARFMRAGRLAHRSPYIQGLYLAGSATHPGQWVSFCAISGILAGNCVVEDLGTC